MNAIEEYKTYESKIGNRKKLYHALQKAYDIKTALYPGSHIDIAPSLVIPNVTYIDNFKGAIKFFKSIEEITSFIKENKLYSDEPEVEFIGQDYTKVILDRKYDLIISQYAGFVAQSTKQYLKKDGYLLCNDSHGDATLAYFDDDFEFIGVLNKAYKIESTNLDSYFKLKNGKDVDLHEVTLKMKGPKYTNRSENYIFRLR